MANSDTRTSERNSKEYRQRQSRNKMSKRHTNKLVVPAGGAPIGNRRGCSSQILNLTPKGDQSGCGISKF